jgi:hypothetical protein
MRELFDLDKKKLKEEDRRLILTKNLNEFLFNEQMKLNNRFFVVSIFAIFISIATLIITSQYNTYNQKLFVIIFLCLLVIYLVYLLVNARININKQQMQIKQGYDELFKYHFNYAKQ